MPSLQGRILRFMVRMGSWARDYTASIPQLRAQFERPGRIGSIPRNVSIRPVDIEGLHAEWIEPADAEDGVILYLHGGAFIGGSCNSHRKMVARIAQASQARALLIEYRLAPEHPFPAALEDAVAAYQWLLRNGTGPEQIVVAGDSAGGNLTITSLLMLREASEPLPAAAVCLSPFTDFELTGDSYHTRRKADPVGIKPEDIRAWHSHYLGNHNPRLPLLSPIYADLHRLPPLLIQVGDDEVLLSDSTRLAERAKAAGVETTLEIWDGLWHVFQFLAPFLPEANRAIGRIGQFIRQHKGLTGSVD